MKKLMSRDIESLAQATHPGKNQTCHPTLHLSHSPAYTHILLEIAIFPLKTKPKRQKEPTLSPTEPIFWGQM